MPEMRYPLDGWLGRTPVLGLPLLDVPLLRAGVEKHQTLSTLLGPTRTSELMSEGLCYERAAEYLLSLPSDEQHKHVLVHGRPTLQCDPWIEYGHAWIEKWIENEPAVAIDPSQNPTEPIEMHALMYYTFGKIDHRKCLIYTVQETRRFLLQTKHYGPWEGPEGTGDIGDLCRSLKPIDHTEVLISHMKSLEDFISEE